MAWRGKADPCGLLAAPGIVLELEDTQAHRAICGPYLVQRIVGVTGKRPVPFDLLPLGRRQSGIRQRCPAVRGTGHRFTLAQAQTGGGGIQQGPHPATVASSIKDGKPRIRPPRLLFRLACHPCPAMIRCCHEHPNSSAHPFHHEPYPRCSPARRRNP